MKRDLFVTELIQTLERADCHSQSTVCSLTVTLERADFDSVCTRPSRVLSQSALSKEHSLLSHSPCSVLVPLQILLVCACVYRADFPRAHIKSLLMCVHVCTELAFPRNSQNDH